MGGLQRYLRRIRCSVFRNRSPLRRERWYFHLLSAGTKSRYVGQDSPNCYRSTIEDSRHHGCSPQKSSLEESWDNAEIALPVRNMQLVPRCLYKEGTGPSVDQR